MLLGPANAFTWIDLWQTKNTQGSVLFKKGEYAKAADTFTDERWKAYAAYKAKNYDKAYQHYLNLKDSNNDYNQGNTLAFMGKYKEAIDAYNCAIATNKQDKDAIYNKSIVEKLLKQQQKSQNQQNKNDKNQNKKQDDKTKNNQNNQKQETKQDKEKSQKPAQPKKKPLQKEDSQKQMNEQLLRLIPDDPGGLLREKFKRDYLHKIGG